MYDIFIVSKQNISAEQQKTIKSKYPTAIVLENIKTFSEIKNRSFTKMFWVIWDDIILNDFNLNDYTATKWDDMYVHIFLNGTYYDGVCLIPKNNKITDDEFWSRKFIDKKEVDIIASNPKPYDKFYISTFNDYLKALKLSSTDLFWAIWPEIEVTDEAVFDAIYNRNENHVFKNLRNGEETYLDGLALFSKNKKVSEREIKHRYLINKKEHKNIASVNRYPRYSIKNYKEYKKILEDTKTEMFWAIWPETKITDESVFDLYFDPRNGMHDIDRTENHMFKNLRNGEETYLDGLVLFSKNNPVSEREIKNRYLINKKEHNFVASVNCYPKYKIKNYTEYKKVLESTEAEMFWAIWPEIEVTDETVFDLYFDPRNGIYDNDRLENHAWQHQLRKNEITFSGLHLMCKSKPVNKKEIDFRFLINKKEHNDIVSKHKKSKFDIVFISYQEPNADENYDKLRKRFPNAKRVHGVKGIHQAHIAASKLCDTEMFWVVDGDAVVVDDFNFNYPIDKNELETVHVWRSKNPINDLVYGYGGIKLLPTKMTINMDTTKTDMTTSISNKFKAVEEVSNITEFNTDPFNTWKSAFRECAKLASKTIKRQKDEETENRLEIWTTVGGDRRFGNSAIQGARHGSAFGSANRDNPSELARINDFDWLYKKWTELSE